MLFQYGDQMTQQEHASSWMLLLAGVFSMVLLSGCTGQYTMSNEVRPGGTVTMLYRSVNFADMPKASDLVAKFVPDETREGDPDPNEFEVTVKSLLRVYPDPVSSLALAIDPDNNRAYYGQLMAVIEFKNLNGQWDGVYNEGADGRLGKIVISDPKRVWGTASGFVQYPPGVSAGDEIEFSSQVRLLPSLSDTLPPPLENVGIRFPTCIGGIWGASCGYHTDTDDQLPLLESQPHVLLKVEKESGYLSTTKLAGAEIEVTFPTNHFSQDAHIYANDYPIVTSISRDPKLQFSSTRTSDFSSTTLKIFLSNPRGFSNSALSPPPVYQQSRFMDLSSIAIAWRAGAENTPTPNFEITSAKFYDLDGEEVDFLSVDLVPMY